MYTFKTRLTAYLLAAVLIFGMLPAVSAAGTFSGGSGTASNPYLVSTVEDLQNIASYPSSHFRQINDISLDGISFSPICSASSTFTGSYNGNGYSISDLTLKANGQYNGLFGTSSGTIRNVVLNNASIRLYAGVYNMRVGAIVGQNKGILSNCSVNGTVSLTIENSSKTTYLGGVCGYSTGTVNGCSFSGSVTHSAGSVKNCTFYTGGIAGCGTVNDSENSGTVTVKTYTGCLATTGGITSFGSAEDCKNTGAVTVTGNSGTELYAGGICGDTEGTIRNCLNEGSIRVEDGEFVFVGGIAGFNTEGLLTGVKNTGTVYGSTSYTNEKETYTDVYAGGVTAYSTGDISYAENTGDVTGESTVGHTDIGGVVGYLGPYGYDYGGSTTRILEYAKNSGTVTATSTGGEGRSGGIAATAYQGTTVRYCCNTGTVKALSSQEYNLVLAGGIVGAVMYGTMLQSCNHGDIHIDNKNYSAFASGLSCSTHATIVDCWNEGNIHSDYKFIGSGNYGTIAGLFWDSDTSCISCYNLGELSAPNYGTSVYGIYGTQGGTDHNSVQYCYSTHLYQDTNRSYLITDEEARLQETYEGFNFDAIWAIDPDLNNGHPYLRNLAGDDDPGWYLDPDAEIPVAGITITPASSKLEIGETLTLTASVIPPNATDVTVRWSSEDSSIAQVTQKGVVTAVKAGGTRITAAAGNYTSSCWVEVTAPPEAQFSGGSGTAADPYQIATVQDLQNVRGALSSYFIQTANIDLDGISFTPIGTASSPFNGFYDGNGFSISHLSVSAGTAGSAGLFGYLSGEVVNIRLTDAELSVSSSSGSVYCGSVAAYNTGTISNCTVSGSVTAKTLSQAQNAYAGGVAGYSTTVLHGCTFSGSVHSKVSYLDSFAYSGGIAGYGAGASNCVNRGTITSEGAAACDIHAAGILGYASGAVSNCYNSGSIDTTEGRRSYSGGITGQNHATVSGCKNAGTIHANTAYTADNVALYALAGGITGSSFGTVRYCENTGIISADSTATHAYAGGVVGYNNSNCTLEYSKNSGPVSAFSSTGGESRAGGIASSSYRDSVVRYCCNTGDVSITDNPLYWSGIAGGVVACLQYGTAYECCSHGDIFIDSKGYEPEGGVVFGSATDSVIRDCYGTGNGHSAYNPTASHRTGYLWGIFSGSDETQCSTSYFTGTLTNNYRCERHGLYKEWGNSDFTVNYLYARNLYGDSGTALTPETAVLQETYQGFDFTNIWAMDPEINSGMPYLRRIPTDSNPNWYDGPEDEIPVTSITLNTTSVVLCPEQTFALEATVLPVNATDSAVTWTSADETIATVSGEGRITTIRSGSTTITATAGSHSAVCSLTVRKHPMLETVIPATCTQQGYTLRQCQYCSYGYQIDHTPVLGHQFEVISATDPTCDEYGFTEGSICARCGEIEKEQVLIEPLGHNYIPEIFQPTCFEMGYTRYQCDRCDDFYEDDFTPALEHDYLAVVTPPTCEADGFTTYTCKFCGDLYLDALMPCLGHDYTDAITTEPTCTTDGERTYTCRNDASHSYTEPISAIGHSYLSAVTTEPTCTTDGIRTFTCQNDSSHTYTETILATGHKDDNDNDLYCDICGTLLCTDHQPETVPGKAATCTESGLTEGSRCQLCGHILKEQTVLPALGHTVVKDTAVTADCTTSGLTEGSHCSVCGTVLVKQEVVPALGHLEVLDFAVDPTCTKTGLTGGTHCSVCSLILAPQETLPALGHDWDSGVVTIAPTCTATGIMTYTCKRDANHIRTDTIAVVGHTDQDGNYRCDVCALLLCTNHQAEIVPGTAATCTETGLTEGSRCKLCLEILKQQTIIPATGHTVVADAPVAATCTKTGLTKGSHCSVCGTVLTAQAVVAALGHHWDIGEITTPATCISTGTKTFTCYNDNHHTYTEEVPLRDHTPIRDAAQVPTCTETGLTEGTHCSVCGTILVEQNILPATGHTDADKDFVCDTCGEDLCTDHQPQTIPGKDATCTADGLTEGSKCSICGHVLREQTAIPARGHSPITDAAAAPTCTETGLTEGSHCKTCGTVLVRQESVPATGHSDTNEDYVCDVCGAALCTNHQAVSIAGKAATCTESGLTEGSKCGRCGHILTEQTVIPALGHKTAIDTGKAATCTEPGLTEGSHCERCGTVLVKQEAVPAKGHAYASVTTAPSCTEQGFTTHTCTVCGHSYTDSVTAALDHSWDSGTLTIAPTCTADGLMTFTCLRDNTHTKTESLPAIGHTDDNDDFTCDVCNAALCTDHQAVSVAGKAATCTDTGLTEGSKCGRCGHILTEQTVIPALGHKTAIDTGKAATCTEPGLTEGSHCARCGTVLVKQEVVPAKGHAYASVTTAPTCTEQGFTTHTCTVCGHSYTDSVTAALDHSWDSGTVTIAPTCTADGLMTFTCLRDNTHTKTESLPAIGHTDDNDDFTCDVCNAALCTDHQAVSVAGKAATCTDTGLTEGSKCGRCGHVLTEQTVIPALGHKTVVVSGKDATCTESGLTEGSHCDRCGTVLVKQEVVPAKGHAYASITTAPSCMEQGHTTHTCTVCGHSYTDAVTAALGHSWNSWTYGDAHDHIRSCQRTGCGETQTAAHTMQDVIENGKPFHRCLDCGHQISALEVAQDGQTVTITLTTQHPALFWGALYEADGQFVELRTGITSGSTTRLTFHSATEGKTIQLFFLNADYTPMLDTVTLP